MVVRTDNYLRELIIMAFIQKRIILVITATVTIGAILVAFLWPPVYVATASIIVKSKKPLEAPSSLEKIRASVPMVTEYDVRSEMELVQSLDVVINTVKRLGKMGINVSKEIPRSLPPQKALLRKARIIRDTLSVETTEKSHVFNVSLKWSDPVQARQILDVLLSEYLIFRSGLDNPSAKARFFKTQLARFDRRLRELEDKTIKLVRSSESADPTNELQNNLIIEQDLERKLNDLIEAWAQKKKYIEFLEREIHTPGISFFSYIDNLAIQDLGKKLQDTTLKLHDLRRTYADSSIPVRRMKEEVKETYEELKKEVQKYIRDQKAQLAALESAIESLKARLKAVLDKNIQLYENKVRMKRLQREIKMLENSYNTVATRWEETKMNIGTDADKLFLVGIASRPHSSNTPVFPKKKVVIPVGFIVGLLTGIAVGFTREFFDHRFKRPEDVTTYTGLSTLGSIPMFS